jgi:hypothetical protein
MGNEEEQGEDPRSLVQLTQYSRSYAARVLVTPPYRQRPRQRARSEGWNHRRRERAAEAPEEASPHAKEEWQGCPCPTAEDLADLRQHLWEATGSVLDQDRLNTDNMSYAASIAVDS